MLAYNSFNIKNAIYFTENAICYYDLNELHTIKLTQDELRAVQNALNKAHKELFDKRSGMIANELVKNNYFETLLKSFPSIVPLTYSDLYAKYLPADNNSLILREIVNRAVLTVDTYLKEKDIFIPVINYDTLDETSAYFLQLVNEQTTQEKLMKDSESLNTFKEKTMEESMPLSYQPNTAITRQQLLDQLMQSKPFENYQQLSAYYQTLSPDEAKEIQMRLVSGHIPSINTTNEALIDFAQLAYCNEDIARAIFNQLNCLAQIPGNDLFNVCGAVVVLCNALQTHQYHTSDEQLIKLLVFIAQNIEQTQQTTGISTDARILRLLAAMNAVLDTILLRALDENNMATMGKMPHEELKKYMRHLEKNLNKLKANHPWPYFLSQRAMKSIEAVQVVKTAVEEKKDKIAALKSAGKIVGGLVGVAGAAAITATTFGAGTPILAVAIIGFGATVVDAFKSSKEIIEGIRSAHKSLSNQHATSLNWFQNMSFSNNEAPKKPLLNWKEEVAPAINSVIEKLNSSELKDSSDVEKMAMIYFMTTLIVNSHAPKKGLKKVCDMLKQFYNLSQKEAHVQLFILESFHRLYATTIHRDTIPKVTIAHYKLILLGEEPTSNAEVKKYEEHTKLLDQQIQIIRQDKSQQYLIAKPAEHRLIQDAWFQWYQNDRALCLIHDHLSDLLTKYSTNDLGKSKYQAQLTALRMQFDEPVIDLGLNDRAWTSDWGRKCYDKIEQVFSTLKISSAITGIGRALWKNCGEIIYGDEIKLIGVEMSKNVFMELYETKEDRDKFMKEMLVLTLQAKLDTEGTSISAAEKIKFIETLGKYIQLEMVEGSKLILGNKRLGVGLALLCSKLEHSAGKPIQSVTPFWHLPSPTIQFNNEDANKTLLELKETCRFEVELVVGQSKPMLRITAIPSQQPTKKATKMLIDDLKNNLLKDLTEAKELIDEKVKPDGLTIEFSSEQPGVLQMVHAWLCQVAAIQPELKENNNPRYQCNVM